MLSLLLLLVILRSLLARLSLLPFLYLYFTVRRSFIAPLFSRYLIFILRYPRFTLSLSLTYRSLFYYRSSLFYRSSLLLLVFIVRSSLTFIALFIVIIRSSLISFALLYFLYYLLLIARHYVPRFYSLLFVRRSFIAPLFIYYRSSLCSSLFSIYGFFIARLSVPRFCLFLFSLSSVFYLSLLAHLSFARLYYSPFSIYTNLTTISYRINLLYTAR